MHEIGCDDTMFFLLQSMYFGITHWLKLSAEQDYTLSLFTLFIYLFILHSYQNWKFIFEKPMTQNLSEAVPTERHSAAWLCWECSLKEMSRSTACSDVWKLIEFVWNTILLTHESQFFFCLLPVLLAAKKKKKTDMSPSLSNLLANDTYCTYTTH